MTTYVVNEEYIDSDGIKKRRDQRYWWMSGIMDINMLEAIHRLSDRFSPLTITEHSNLHWSAIQAHNRFGVMENFEVWFQDEMPSLPCPERTTICDHRDSDLLLDSKRPQSNLKRMPTMLKFAWMEKYISEIGLLLSLWRQMNQIATLLKFLGIILHILILLILTSLLLGCALVLIFVSMWHLSLTRKGIDKNVHI